MTKRTSKKAADAQIYETKHEIEARINALQIARRQTNDITIEHMEVYFRTLTTEPTNTAKAFAAMDLLTEAEADYMTRTFCADCTCFNDVLSVREIQRQEIAALEEQLLTATDDPESGVE